MKDLRTYQPDGAVIVRSRTGWQGYLVPRGDLEKTIGQVVRQLKQRGLTEACKRIQSATLLTAFKQRVQVGPELTAGFLVLVDEPARTLEVWCEGEFDFTPGAFGLPGFWRRVATELIRDDGVVALPQLAPSLPPWPRLPIHDDWADPSAEAERSRAVRADVRRRLERDCAQAGLTLEVFTRVVALALSELLFTAPWEGEAPSPGLEQVYVTFRWRPDSSLWRTRVESVEVLYPPPWLRPWSADVLTLWASGPRTAQADVNRRNIVKCFAGADVAKLEPIFTSAMPIEGWVFAFLDLLRGLERREARAVDLSGP